MNIFKVQLEKGECFMKYIWKQIEIAETAPSIKSVEMDLMTMQATGANGSLLTVTDDLHT